jgi:hypothetical protein
LRTIPVERRVEDIVALSLIGAPVDAASHRACAAGTALVVQRGHVRERIDGRVVADVTSPPAQVA